MILLTLLIYPIKNNYLKGFTLLKIIYTGLKINYYMKKYIILGSMMALMPVLTFAKPAEEILKIFEKIMGVLMPILVSLAVIFFIISLVMFILKEGEEKAKAKTQMVWGIVILFVMISIWGLVDILVDTFGITEPAPTNLDTKLLPK